MQRFISFIFIGSIIVLGLLLSRDLSSITPSASPSPTAEAIAQGGGAPTGNLYIAQKSQTGTEIQRISVTDKQVVTVFSDKSSQKKLQVISPVTGSGDTLLAIRGDAHEPVGDLISIATDGSGTTTTLIPNFANSSAAAPILSSDKTKIAYISYANDSTDPGFQLVTMNITGSERRVWLTSPTTINSLRFSADNTKIAYLTEEPSSNNVRLTIYSLTANKQELTRVFQNNTPTLLDWSPLGLILISDTLLDPLQDSRKQVIDGTNNLNAAVLAPDASGVAYLEDGTVTVVDTNQTTKTTLSNASLLLGWTQ